MDEELTELLTRLTRAGAVSEGDVMCLRDAVWTEETIASPQSKDLYVG